MAGHGQAQTRPHNMEGYVLDVCQEFARDNCQGKLSQQPVYTIVANKAIVFFSSKPMAKMQGFFDILDQNKDAIMALLSFNDPIFNTSVNAWGPGKPNEPNTFVYDFDVNPTFVLEYGTLTSYYNFLITESNQKSGYQAQPTPGQFDTVTGNPYTLAQSQAAMDLARKAIVLEWLLYTGPVGSQITFETQVGISGGSQIITSVAVPNDIDTPAFGSILKLTELNYEAPTFNPVFEPSFGLNFYFIHWGASIGYSDVATGMDILATYGADYPLVHGDYGGSGGSGSAGAGSAGGSGGSDP